MYIPKLLGAIETRSRKKRRPTRQIAARSSVAAARENNGTKGDFARVIHTVPRGRRRTKKPRLARGAAGLFAHGAESVNFRRSRTCPPGAVSTF